MSSNTVPVLNIILELPTVENKEESEKVTEINYQIPDVQLETVEMSYTDNMSQAAVEAYQKLSEKCDIVLSRIRDRKKNKKNSKS
jgi:hypothetical protein